MPDEYGNQTPEERRADNEALGRSKQAELDAEERMNSARIGAQMAISAAELAQRKYEFDTAFNGLSADQKEKYKYMRETFYAELGQKQREFYANTALGLLNGAAGLKGPEDWLSYANYTSGGRDLFQTLYGNEAVPAFGAPTGYSAPSTLESLMKRLGITAMPGSGSGSAPGTTPSDPAADNAMLDWIWANAASKGHNLADFYKSNGWDVSTPEGQRRAVQNWIGQADPQWKGMNPAQVAAKLGYTAPAAPSTPATTNPPPTVPGGMTAPPNAQTATGVNSQTTGNALPGGVNAQWQNDPSMNEPTLPDPAQPGATSPVTGQPGGADWYEAQRQWYRQFVAANGRPPTREEWLAAYIQNAKGLTAWGESIYDQGDAYFAKNQREAPAEEVARWQTEAQAANPLSQGQGNPYATTTEGWYEAQRQWYRQFVATNGRPPTRDEWLDAFQKNSGQLRAVGQDVYDQGQSYFSKHGREAPVYDVNNWTQQASSEIVPLPYQINPAVWDSYTPEKQAMILAAAQKGKTPSGAYSAENYLGQINAARPKGTAPKSTTTNWGSLANQSWF